MTNSQKVQVIAAAVAAGHKQSATNTSLFVNPSSGSTVKLVGDNRVNVNGSTVYGASAAKKRLNG